MTCGVVRFAAVVQMRKAPSVLIAVDRFGPAGMKSAGVPIWAPRLSPQGPANALPPAGRRARG